MIAESTLCSVSTRGRYDTTLPHTLLSIANQTLLPGTLVIFDDNDTPVDLRNNPLYLQIFQMLEAKGVEWKVLFGERKGQHFNHQRANMMGYEFVWRLDDDTVAEPNVLQQLMDYMQGGVGAVGGSILSLPYNHGVPRACTGKIEDIDNEPNYQWSKFDSPKSLDHLHCSFLYRAGIQDYNLALSRVAHREETLFTYGLKKRGYQVLAVPCVTWHMRAPVGGIRDGQKELFDHDEHLFRLMRDHTVVVLDCGRGDHMVFKKVLDDIDNPLVFTCYPDIVPGLSIADAQKLIGDISYFNIYSRMDDWGWKRSLESAFRKFYWAPSR